ncbi:MAG TPA: AAA family ATPase [Thermomicrobiales bacterium]|nr:AAA family ATPase [Thermomicrobiales bacterium]
MAQRQRSPLGELVYAYRTSRNMTQAQLAGAIAAQHGLAGERISVRTISNIEQRYAANEPWMVPQQATVDILAAHFHLTKGSPEWNAFQGAANATRFSAAATQDTCDADVFVAAGREWHLQRLEHDLDALVAGRSGLLLITAEAGAGKTTLLLHAVRAAVERHENLVVLWGNSTTESHPYQPMRQMTGAALGMQEHASIEQLVSPRNRQRLLDRAAIIQRCIANEGKILVDRLVPTAGLDATDADVHPDSTRADVGGAGRSPTVDEHEFLEQGWLALQGYAAAGPVVMVVDNLHLADEGTTAVLLHRVRRLQHSSAPILILGAYRPFDLQPAPGAPTPPFAAALRELNHYVYDPVINLGTAVGGHQGHAYVKALITSRVKDAPPTLVDDVFALTKGLPLFVDAVLRWYQTGGTVRRATPADPLQWDELAPDLPTEMATVIDDLFARLAPDHRNMLQAASVQGTVFSADVLQRTLGLSRTALIDALAMILANHANIVEQAGTRMIAGHKSYDFSFFHAPLRDFIYHRLDSNVRRDLHRQSASAMIELWGDEPHQGAMLIARQFEQAGDLVEAARWYLRAGDFHLFRHEHRQAVPFYQRIQNLNVLDKAPFFTVQAKVGLGNCARGLGDLPLADLHLSSASTQARQQNLPLVEANALTSLGMVGFDLGQMEAASDHLARAVEILRKAGERVEVCRSLALLSHALHGQGRYEDALHIAAEAMSLADDLDRDDLYVYGLVANAECLLTTGDTMGAIALAKRGYVIAEEYGDSHRMVLCALAEAQAWIERENTPNATLAIDRVFALHQSINGRMTGAGWFGRGLLALQNRHFDEAKDMFQESLRLRQGHYQHALQTDSEVGLLRVALAQGNPGAIHTLSDSIQQRVARLGTDGIEHPAHLFIALMAAGAALNDEALVTSARKTGQELIRQRAEMLSDANRRARYLHQVRANRQLLSMADS